MRTNVPPARKCRNSSAPNLAEDDPAKAGLAVVQAKVVPVKAGPAVVVVKVDAADGADSAGFVPRLVR